MTVVDPDHGESHAVAVPDAVSDKGLGTYSVDADGHWSYTVNNAAVQHLSETETATDTFTVTSLDGTASQQVVITIQGQNDAPFITSSQQSGAVQEDLALTAQGQVTASDPDDGDHQHYSGNANGAYGAFVVDPVTGQWTYTLDNANSSVQALAAGETHDETFTVTVTDDFGATTQEDVTVHVSGNNDAPDLQAIVPTGQELTDTGLTLTGVMAFTDVDLIDHHTVTITAQGAGYIGTVDGAVTDSTGTGQGSVNLSFSLTKDQFDAAFPSGQLPDRYQQDYLVTIDDGHGGSSSQLVSVPLSQILSGAGGGSGGDGGSNHDPVIYIDSTAGDTAAGMVFDDVGHPDRQFAIGRLSFSDEETQQAHSVYVDSGTGSGPEGVLGTMSVEILRDTDGSVKASDPDGFLLTSPTGGALEWNYHVDEQMIQRLGEGETRTDTFQVILSDDHGGSTTQQIAVTVQGTNDLPVLQGDGVHSLYLNGPFSDSANPFAPVGGQEANLFGFVDPDPNDTHTVSAVLDLNHSTVNPSANFNATLQDENHGVYSTNGEISWTYQLNESDTPYLPGHEGEQRIQTWDVTIDDGHGETVVPFVVTFNSTPTIQGADITEIFYDVSSTGQGTLSFEDNLAFDDVDPTDTHSVNVQNDYGPMNGGAPVGTLSASVTNDTQNGTGGLAHYTYSRPEHT